MEVPYIELGQISTIFYFSYFILIISIISIIEKTLAELPPLLIEYSGKPLKTTLRSSLLALIFAIITVIYLTNLVLQGYSIHWKN